MGRKYQITESQFEFLMKRLTEVAAGYDDHFVMSTHSGGSMGRLIFLLTDLVESLKETMSLLNTEDVNTKEVISHFESVNDRLDIVSEMMIKTFKDFTEREVINKGKLLVKKIKQYQRKIGVILHYGSQLTDSDEEFFESIGKETKKLAGFTLDYSHELRNSSDKLQGILQRNKPKYDMD
jgi:hypothetical protein